MVITRAKTILILSNEYIEKTRALLAEYGKISIITFSSFWEMKYDECIDFIRLRYKGGLVGFLRDNDHLFYLERNKNNMLMVSLISRPGSRYSSDSSDPTKENSPELSKAIAKQRPIDRTIIRLFNETNYLWTVGQCRAILRRKNSIYITPSAYESALDIYHDKACAILTRIGRTLRFYATGLRVDQLYKYIRIDEALQVFGVSISANSLIDELPEVFFRQYSDNPEEDLIFDGTLHSISDLTGLDDGHFKEDKDPETIVTRAINGGVYQKTLILIWESGQVKGLKINVWMKSLKVNFYNKNEKAFEHDMEMFDTMSFFLALARYNLVELRSHEVIKNDIRAFLPRRYPGYQELKSNLPNLFN